MADGFVSYSWRLREPSGRANARARVKLADIHVAWHPEGQARGVALFDLEAPISDTCELELPEGGSNSLGRDSGL